MADFITNYENDVVSSLFHSREQFLTLHERDNFNETLDYYKTWVHTYEEVTKQKAWFDARGYIVSSLSVYNMI